MQFCRLRPAVYGGDLHQDVFRVVFGIFHEDVEVPVVLEDAGVEEFVLHVVFGTTPVRLYQIRVSKCRLRILVQVLHTGMGRGAVEVEVILFHILAVVAFAVGEAEEPLLQDGVLLIPQGQCEAQVLLVIGNASDAVLAPAVGARAGLIVGEEILGVTPSL